MWVFICEAGWLIYGNTFIYSDNCKNCEYETAKYSVQTERTTCLVIIIYGYLLLIGIVGLILFYISLYFGYKAYVEGDMENLRALEEGDNTANSAGGLSRQTTMSNRMSRMIEGESNPTMMLAFRNMTTRRFTGTESARMAENALQK